MKNSCLEIQLLYMAMMTLIPRSKTIFLEENIVVEWRYGRICNDDGVPWSSECKRALQGERVALMSSCARFQECRWLA
uniref:Uncharacterized protein n=1 Tax=Setaria italica TaxID=4555 RepID=K3XTX8_SETIT